MSNQEINVMNIVEAVARHTTDVASERKHTVIVSVPTFNLGMCKYTKENDDEPARAVYTGIKNEYLVKVTDEELNELYPLRLTKDDEIVYSTIDLTKSAAKIMIKKIMKQLGIKREPIDGEIIVAATATRILEDPRFRKLFNDYGSLRAQIERVYSIGNSNVLSDDAILIRFANTEAIKECFQDLRKILYDKKYFSVSSQSSSDYLVEKALNFYKMRLGTGCGVQTNSVVVDVLPDVFRIPLVNMKVNTFQTLKVTTAHPFQKKVTLMDFTRRQDDAEFCLAILLTNNVILMPRWPELDNPNFVSKIFSVILGKLLSCSTSDNFVQSCLHAKNAERLISQFTDIRIAKYEDKFKKVSEKLDKVYSAMSSYEERRQKLNALMSIARQANFPELVKGLRADRSIQVTNIIEAPGGIVITFTTLAFAKRISRKVSGMSVAAHHFLPAYDVAVYFPYELEAIYSTSDVNSRFVQLKINSKFFGVYDYLKHTMSRSAPRPFPHVSEPMVLNPLVATPERSMALAIDNRKNQTLIVSRACLGGFAVRLGQAYSEFDVHKTVRVIYDWIYNGINVEDGWGETIFNFPRATDIILRTKDGDECLPVDSSNVKLFNLLPIMENSIYDEREGKIIINLC